MLLRVFSSAWPGCAPGSLASQAARAMSLNRSSAARTGALMSKHSAISMDVKERRSMGGCGADRHHAAMRASFAASLSRLQVNLVVQHSAMRARVWELLEHLTGMGGPVLITFDQ